MESAKDCFNALMHSDETVDDRFQALDLTITTVLSDIKQLVQDIEKTSHIWERNSIDLLVLQVKDSVKSIENLLFQLRELVEERDEIGTGISSKLERASHHCLDTEGVINDVNLIGEDKRKILSDIQSEMGEYSQSKKEMYRLMESIHTEKTELGRLMLALMSEFEAIQNEPCNNCKTLQESVL
ncbi:hypothetical protein QAD02_010766 [Eretmocerus hayati]|uniref:Uncharacterized protein n=1 Tax=Eretmocerus hayati TaxID=131215 RepID=A0ACC2NUQ1_9HYME|nr:hypothetical protein QAD02_010766 [Eretmocerus hayati]